MKGLSGSEVTAELKRVTVSGRFEFLLITALKNIEEMAVSGKFESLLRILYDGQGHCFAQKDEQYVFIFNLRSAGVA